VTAEHGQASLEMATEGVTEGAAPVQTPSGFQVVTLVPAAVQAGLPVIPVQVLQIAPAGAVPASPSSVQQQIMDQVFRGLPRCPIAVENQNIFDTPSGERNRPAEVLDSQLWNGMDWLAANTSYSTNDGQVSAQPQDNQVMDGVLSVQAVDDYFAQLGDDPNLD
jgi:hypothetical protein